MSRSHDRPVTPHALTDALLRLAMNEFGRWDRDGSPYADCYAAMRAVLAPALVPKTCSTCAHVYGTHQSYCSKGVRPPESFGTDRTGFGCTLHTPAEKGPRT